MDYSFDLQRIFFGDLPPVFLLEILFRTVFLFLYTLILLRFVGQRGIGQLSLFEWTIIIALGSAVGDPLFYPDVPLTHGMMVVFVIVIVQRLLNVILVRSHRVEKLVEGVPHRIVADGEIDLGGKAASNLTYEEIYMALRQHKIENLGQVRRAFFEPDGEFSLFLFGKEDIRPGLPLLPDDPAHEINLEQGTDTAGDYACAQCGHVQPYAAHARAMACPRCGYTRWRAVIGGKAAGTKSGEPPDNDAGEVRESNRPCAYFSTFSCGCS